VEIPDPPLPQPTHTATVETLEKPDASPVSRTDTEVTSESAVEAVEKPGPSPVGPTDIQPASEAAVEAVEKPGSSPVGPADGPPASEPAVEAVEKPSSSPVGPADSRPASEPAVEAVEKPSPSPVGPADIQLASEAAVEAVEKPGPSPVGPADSQLASEAAVETVEKPGPSPVGPTGPPARRPGFVRLAQTIIAPFIGLASRVGKFLSWRWAISLLAVVCIAVIVWWLVRPHPINLADERAKAEKLIFGNAPIQAIIAEGAIAERLGYRDVAALLFKHAADNNSVEGARRLGVVYDPTRRSTSPDQEPKADLCSAFTWYTKAAVLGDGIANEQIDHLKEWAEGAERDGDWCARQLRQDFDLASAKAMIEGNVPPSAALEQAKKAQEKSRFDIAILLFRYAADHDSAEGARRLGMVYDPTLPTVDANHQPKANACFAYTWYKRASDLRDPSASKYLSKLEDWAKDAASRGDQCAQDLLQRGQP
jgi:hypothetical protein